MFGKRTLSAFLPRESLGVLLSSGFLPEAFHFGRCCDISSESRQHCESMIQCSNSCLAYLIFRHGSIPGRLDSIVIPFFRSFEIYLL